MRTYQNHRNTRKKNNSRRIFLFILTGIILCVFGWVIYSLTKNPWYCQDGKWVTDKVTDKPMPDELCPADTDQNESENNARPDQKYIDIDSQKNAEGIDIRIFEPHVNATINSPLNVSGEAKNWYLDNSFDVLLLDEEGVIVARSDARATDDVVADAYVQFETVLTFELESGMERGTIVFQKSEAMEQQGSFSFPVFFK